MITSNQNAIPDARVCNIISKGPKFRFTSNIDFPERSLLLYMTLVTVGANVKMSNLMP